MALLECFFKAVVFLIESIDGDETINNLITTDIYLLLIIYLITKFLNLSLVTLILFTNTYAISN